VNRGEKPKSKAKQFFYILITSLLALSISLVYASVFVYYPTPVNVQGVRPPVIFQAIPGIPATISPWGTYANVPLLLPLIVENANFSGTLSPWNRYSNVSWASWNAVQVSGALDNYASSYSGRVSGFFGWGSFTGYIYQSIDIPSVSGASSYNVSVVVRFNVASLSNILSLTVRFGLYNPNTGQWMCSGNPSYNVGSWVTASLSCTVQPGTYQIRVVVSGYYFYILSSSSFVVYIDYLYVSIYSFSGAVLNVTNTDSQPYYAKLALDSVTGSNPQSLYCEINLGGSQPIEIRGGQIVVGETPEVVLYPSSSTPINVNCLATSSGSYALNLTLKYCTLPGGSGACVFYPLTITLTAG